jgi:nitroreductase
VIKGSDVRRADYPIDPLFVDRWSARAMTGEPIDNQELFRLFEAARWAPSAGNSQPWRIFYAHRDTEQWPLFFDLLVESNQAWCRLAAVLVVFASSTIREGSGKPLVTHSYDTGSAWENFFLQGMKLGLVVHGMAGFDYARAKRDLQMPDELKVEAMAAVGRPGPLENLPESFRPRETPSLRKPISEFVFEGGFVRR